MTPEPPQDPQQPDLRKDPQPGYQRPEYPEYRAPGYPPPPGYGQPQPPPAYQGVPQGIPPEPYENGVSPYQAFPGAYGPYGHVPAYGPRTNVLAIVSLIASIVSCGIGSVVGVVCGHIALNQMRRSGEAGRGLAVAGLVLGYLGLLAAVGVIVMLVVGASLGDDYSSYDTP
ncbi:DUF4190 domain-containing protein [Actinocorallia longicatena]|uniref:DUF4190 domain-containing protein n=1 Tax=Actinocorallia longicatena TaxID=111803 RepID=A0ABP6Q1P1_9ACTN